MRHEQITEHEQVPVAHVQLYFKSGKNIPEKTLTRKEQFNYNSECYTFLLAEFGVCIVLVYMLMVST